MLFPRLCLPLGADVAIIQGRSRGHVSVSGLLQEWPGGHWVGAALAPFFTSALGLCCHWQPTSLECAPPSQVVFPQPPFSFSFLSSAMLQHSYSLVRKVADFL